jgi:hypothetical protein
MALVTLEHCIEVTVWTALGGPEDVNVTLDTTSYDPGDGTVEITGAPGEVSPPVSVPLGSAHTEPLSKVTKVVLHYKKAEGGPPQITVAYDIAPR